jgi:FkbM family methyltransferase
MTRRRASIILVVIAFLVLPVILSRVAPAVPLRAYFSLERKFDWQSLRDLEPFLIKTGLLRQARMRVRGGFTMALNPQDLVPLMLLRTGEWQPEVWDALASALPPDSVLLDVGAHIGIFTLKGARHVGSKGRVIAFEPNPETVKLLRENISANHLENVTVEQIACTDRPQQLTLFAAPTNNTGASSLSQVNATYGASPRPFQVRGRPIDDVIRELQLDRVDAMKIDVEGAELQVLRGAAETLKRFHPRIVVEIVPSQLANFGSTPKDIASFIRSTGYSIGVPLTTGATDWEWMIGQSMVKMSDPATAPQLLKGFGGLESNTWRWTAKTFDIALHPPDGAPSTGATLVGKFIFPGVAFHQLKQVRLSAKIDGVELPAATFASEGEHEYRARIPARMLQSNPVEIDFALDKSLKDDLGLIALSIGFVNAKE